MAVLDALHATVTYLARVDRIGFKLRIREHDREALTRTELGSEERTRIPEFAKASEKCRHTVIHRNVRCRQSGTHRTAPALAEVSCERIDRFAAVEVRHRNGLIAVVLEKAVQFPKHHRPVDRVQRGIAHGRVVQELRPFLDSAKTSARDAEAENDHRLRAGEDITGIVLLIHALPAAHRCDSDDIRAAFLCLGLDFSRSEFTQHLLVSF